MLTLDVEELWGRKGDLPLLDVRSPAEYAHGHIPGARNLPLFTDEQRAEVGTLYKQVSPEQAFLRGLDFAGARMRWYVEEAERLAPARSVLLHCWRGGQRSGSLAWLLNLAGFEVGVLKGGYKAYRRYLLAEFLERRLPLLVLGGATGSGKTEVLHALREKGEQVIDLEGLAHHKGSAFGAHGQPPQPSQQQFENELFEQFRDMDPSRRVWLENESRTIGQNGIPDGFWEQMRGAPFIQLELPFEHRVQRLVLEYGDMPATDLARTFQNIRKRLGGQNLQLAEAALEAGDLAEAARIALRYYDKAYRRSTGQMEFCKKMQLAAVTVEADPLAEALIKMAEENGL